MSALSDGELVPEFTLRDQHGAPVSLHQLRKSGRVAVIFFPFAHTSICTDELRAVSEALGDFERFGVAPVAISCDSMFTLRVLADSERIGFPLLSDFWPHGRVASDYGVFDAERGCALRGTFLVEPDGTLGWQVVNQLPDPRPLSELFTRLRDLAEAEGSADAG